MKIYVAGSFSGRKRIKIESDRLKARGYTVLSKWYEETHFIEKAWDDNFSGDVASAMAMTDMYAILEADLVILDTIDKSSTGGSDSELGAAIMRDLVGNKLRIIHIGPYRNVFQTLVKEHYSSWEDADVELWN